MRKKKPSSIRVSRARPKKLKDLPQESTTNTIFPDRNYYGRSHSNEFHDSYMGVIGIGQTQVKRGDRKEFKALDLKHSVRIRQGSQTHAKRHSHFSGPKVASGKSHVASNNSFGKMLYPSVMSKPQLGPGSAIGFADGEKWRSPGGPYIPQFANTPHFGPSVNCSSMSPSTAVGLTSLSDGSAATSSWSWRGEDFPGPRSYQDPSSYPYLGGLFPEMGHSR